MLMGHDKYPVKDVAPEHREKFKVNGWFEMKTADEMEAEMRPGIEAKIRAEQSGKKSGEVEADLIVNQSIKKIAQSIK